MLKTMKRAALIVARVIAFPFTVIDWAFGLLIPYS